MTFPRRVPEHSGWTAVSFCAPASLGYLWATAGSRRSLKNVCLSWLTFSHPRREESAHAAADPCRCRRSVRAREAGDHARSSLRDPDRDEVGGQGHRDLAQPRRDAARLAGRPSRAGGPAGISPGSSRPPPPTAAVPKPGTRVVGILPSGAWAERVNCRSHAVAALPDAVSDAAGRHFAGRRADRAARAAPGRAAARPQGAGRRRLGRGRASRLPARRGGRRASSGAMCDARNTALRWPNGAASASWSAASSPPPSRTGRSG